MNAILAAIAIISGGDEIKPPPASLGLDSFYRKCVFVHGIPIVSSAKVDDRALREAQRLVEKMMKKRPEMAKPMIERKLRIAIMAQSEQTLDIPEHSDLQKAFPDTDWNKRARGLGATLQRPCVSGAEENLLALPGDRYNGESILIHEFGHTVLNFGMEAIDNIFRKRLAAEFERSKGSVWKNTYAATNVDEYWAEGVQSWFDCNQKGPPGGNGVHNHLWNRNSLAKADPGLSHLLEEVFISDWKWSPPPHTRTK
jgi:hypothetical protein